MIEIKFPQIGAVVLPRPEPITEELKRLVIEEAKALRQHARPEELDRLDTETLDPDWADKCLYGQLTGNAYSKRAKFLLIACSKPYSRMVDRYLEPKAGYGAERIFRDFSPIECYIGREGAKIKELIRFLKEGGELNL